MQSGSEELSDLAQFGALVRARRKALKLSQEAVAAAAFDNPDRKSFVSAIENARRSGVSLETALKLAATLNIPLQDLPASLRPITGLGTDPAPLGLSEQAFSTAFNERLLTALQSSVLDAYLERLSGGLASLRTWTGGPFSLRSLLVSFSLSYLYLVYLGLAAYAAGGGQIGGVAPFRAPDWATSVPNWILALTIALVLLGTGLGTYLLVRPPKPGTSTRRMNAAKVALGAVLSGLGCAIAGVLGAEPIAVALSIALFAFGAVSIWPPKVAATATACGALIAGFGNALTNQGGFSFDLLDFAIFGGLLGGLAGGLASVVAQRITGQGPASLAASGIALMIGASGAAFSILMLQGSQSARTEGQAVLVLMWFILPLANAMSDYVSLGISHRLGVQLLGKGKTWAAVVLVGVADLLAAIACMAIALVLIHGGLLLGQEVFGLSVVAREFINQGAADPWGQGLWLSMMLLTTFAWTCAHLLLVVFPLIAAKLVGVLIEVRMQNTARSAMAMGLADLNTASSLTVRKLAFVVFWTVPSIGLVVLIGRYFSSVLGLLASITPI